MFSRTASGSKKSQTAPLMQSLYDWIQTQMKTLSRHSDTAKAFAYLLKQWEALNVYCSNGWVEIDNNIAENALRGVAVGRKNWLFAGSDSGGEHAAVLYSLIGTCRLNMWSQKNGCATSLNISRTGRQTGYAICCPGK